MEQEETSRQICSNDSEKVLFGWFKFFIGLVILAILIFFFASGYSPPGISGEVLRHNQAEEIDASPQFYTEVENMSELEDGVKRLRMQKKLKETGRNQRFSR